MSKRGRKMWENNVRKHLKATECKQKYVKASKNAPV